MKYIDDIQENATLIIDPNLVHEEEISEIINERNIVLYKSRATFAADKKIGRKIVANIVMLGSFVEITGMISEEAAKKAILDSVPKGTEEMNLKAFEVGTKIVNKE